MLDVLHLKESNVMNKKISEEKKMAFLTVLAETCNVSRAAKAIGISRITVYEWRDAFAEFAAAWDKAKQLGVDALEDEAHRRAFEGNEKAVYHQGTECGVIREYSDTLAIFLLKAHKPAKYRENAHLNITGNVDLAEGILAARRRCTKP